MLKIDVEYITSYHSRRITNTQLRINDIEYTIEINENSQLEPGRQLGMELERIFNSVLSQSKQSEDLPTYENIKPMPNKLEIHNISDWFDNYWLDKHLKKFSHEDLQEIIPFRDLLLVIQAFERPFDRY